MSWPYVPRSLVRGEGDDAFILLRRLDQGATAYVYEAELLRTRAHVALKILRPDAPSVRLQREREALKGLFHRNIVRLVSFGMTQDPLRLPYLATTFLVGASVRRVLIEQERIRLDTAVGYARDLFSALAAAHALNIAHRDLRPENVFLERFGGAFDRLVLHDFGLVCPAHGRFPTAQGLIGDPRYAAPELHHGGVPTFRTDLYAAGLVVYEMLTGHHALEPCRGDWRETHAVVPPARLDLLLPDVPAALADLVHALLAKHAGKRPASAAECVSVLEGVLEDLESRPLPNATAEDDLNSLLRRIGGPEPDEDTQVHGPSSSALRRAVRTLPMDRE